MNFSLDREQGISLTAQLFEQMKARILDGSLEGGTRLPSTREMAGDLGLSRNTVLEVYDQLYAEGFVHSKRGDGTYVAEGITFASGPLPEPSDAPQGGFKPFNDNIIDFRTGLPDLHVLPVKKWLALTRDVFLNAEPADFAYGQPGGREELRRAIAAYTAAFRGVRCRPEQILITGGTTQAIGILSELLLRGENRDVCLEDPVTNDIQTIVSRAGGLIRGIPLDEEGLQVGCLKEQSPPAFVYTTPSHHYPLGITMSIKRRIELIEYARREGVYILEDDYDSEFRYDVSPMPSLQGLDPERVIYIGTFSKTLFPALRIGYIILPPELIGEARKLKWFSDLHNPVMDQLVLARFIGEGHYNRSVAKMKKRHRTRRDYLLSSLKKHFGDRAEILGSEAGIHVAVRFPGMNFTVPFLKDLETRGVRVYSVEDHAITKGRYADTIVLGYGFVDMEKMERGIEILKELMT